MPPLLEFIWLALIGLVAGASGGLLGIGGSTVMIPGLVLVFGATPGDRQHLYQAAAMIVNFFVVAPAVLRHHQARATLRSITRCTVPAAVAGAIAGVYLSERPMFRGPGQGYLQIGFAIFLAYAIAYNLLRLRSRQRLPPMDDARAAGLSKAKIVGLVGLPAGLAGGLLGVGGGLVAVPAQQVFLRVPLTNAIANSASTILWSSVIGAAVKLLHLSEHGFRPKEAFVMALGLTPLALLASWYTSEKVHRWPTGVIRAAFVILMLYCGTRVFAEGWRQIAG